MVVESRGRAGSLRCGVLGRAASTTSGAPCVLASRRPARPLDEHHSAEPSYSSDAAPTSATAATAAATFAVLLLGAPLLSASETIGSNRAETTWSGPICTWIPWRICCVTSGRSLRHAVAFWRPWPRRSSPKLKDEPDFWESYPHSRPSITAPSQETPVQDMTA